ncbi:hypothetical protein CSIRO_4031 [Bradyrhizobiaceae bacterium SG-6C]|nr:hypothetical protein CSIRO_4031 [Bradyrhizobiaceae bacterium SG-6C]
MVEFAPPMASSDINPNVHAIVKMTFAGEFTLPPFFAWRT